MWSKMFFGGSGSCWLTRASSSRKHGMRQPNRRRRGYLGKKSHEAFSLDPTSNAELITSSQAREMDTLATEVRCSLEDSAIDAKQKHCPLGEIPQT